MYASVAPTRRMIEISLRAREHRHADRRADDDHRDDRRTRARARARRCRRCCAAGRASRSTPRRSARRRRTRRSSRASATRFTVAGSRKPGLSCTSIDAGSTAPSNTSRNSPSSVCARFERLLLRDDLSPTAPRGSSRCRSPPAPTSSGVVPSRDERANLHAILELARAPRGCSAPRARTGRTRTARRRSSSRSAR